MLRLLGAHLGSKRVSRVVYGAIIGLAVVVGLEAHPPRAGVVVASLLGSAVAVALAEIYSEAIGAETRNRRRVKLSDLGEDMKSGAAVAFGVGFPAVFFILAAAGAMDLDSAFTVAKWSGVGLIGFYGFCAASLAGEGLASSLLHGTLIALVGGFLIALKALVH